MDLPFPFYNYDPYTKPFLGFIIYTANKSSISVTTFDQIDVDQRQGEGKFDTTSTHQENIFSSFTNIDLYRKPVLPPIFSLVVIPIIKLIFVGFGMFIQFRTLQMLKTETSVNNLMMVTQAKIHIIFWPIWTLAVMSTESIYPLRSLITPFGCHFLKFYVYFSLFSFIFYSFYASLLRYLFCIHTDRVTQFGREKLVKLLYWMFYIHTFLWTIYTHATTFDMDHLPLINSCFGIQHKVFLVENSGLNMLKRHFCVLSTGTGTININGTNIKHSINWVSFMYYTYHEIIWTLVLMFGFWASFKWFPFHSDFPSIMARTSCSINSVMIVVAWFNVPEFLFYLAIYLHEKR